jgi:hypothetical protein
MERLILDPERLEKLTRKARDLRERLGDIGNGSANPASRVAPVEPRAHETRPTAEEVKADYENLTVSTGMNFAVARFLFAERGCDSETNLRLARKAFFDESSDANLLFLEAAINQVTSKRALDKEGEKVVENAIQDFISGDQPKNAKGVDG